MIRAAKLAPSRPMYAFKPDTWRPTSYGVGYEVDAAWFKRKNGRTVAMVGVYHPMVLRRDQQPTDGRYESWIAAADDNRHGGTWLEMWDGTAMTPSNSSIPLARTMELLDFLRAMLDGYPNPPAGYDGWWTFERKPAVGDAATAALCDRRQTLAAARPR